MRTKIINGLSIACLTALIISCNEKKEETIAATATVVVDKDQVKKEIQAKENEFANAYNAGEKKSIGYFADDATSFAQNKPPLVGKQAIVDYLLSSIDSNTISNKISFTTNEVFPSSDGNQVLEIGYYKVVDASNTAVNTGNY